jgi:hypothetical protein
MIKSNRDTDQRDRSPQKENSQREAVQKEVGT